VIHVFDKRKPSVKSLARKGDLDGLIVAAGYTELVAGPEGKLVDVGASIREQALIALRDMAPNRAGRHVFVWALADSSDRVRCAATVALYERGDSDRLADAVARLPVTEGRARAIAARALLELRKPGSSSKLAYALVHSQDDLPLSDEDAALVTGLLRVEERPEALGEVVELLIAALAHEREIVTERAEALLVRLGTSSTDALVRELASGDLPHRAAAMLGEIKDARALRPLLAALSHPDARVRCQSCFALGELHDPAAVEPLLRATRDPEHKVRVLAGAALDGMGTAAVAVSVAALLRPMLSEPLGTEGLLRMLPDGDELAPGVPAAHGDEDLVERIEVLWESGVPDVG
jgi:HEAT repeat protein